MSSISTTSIGQRVTFYPDLPTAVNFGSYFPRMTEEEFFDFCQQMDPLRVERDRDGEIIIMAPTYSETAGQNFDLAVEFGIWVRKDGRGRGFDSSSGFILANGATRSPDLSWILHEKWNALSESGRAGFAHICPDFIVELRSKSDNLKKLDAKMREYIDNGAQLGWLIDPIEKTAYIYRPGREVEALDDPAEISGEPLLPEFILTLAEIWE